MCGKVGTVKDMERFKTGSGMDKHKSGFNGHVTS